MSDFAAFQEHIKNFMAEMKAENKQNSDKQETRDQALAKDLRKMEEAQTEMRRDLMNSMQTEFKKYDNKIDELTLLFEHLAKRVNKVEEITSVADIDGDLPMGSGGSTPVQQDNKKRKGQTVFSSARGASLPPMARVPPPTTTGTTERKEACAIFFGGWERPVATHLREGWYKKEVLLKIPAAFREAARFKGLPMRRFFTVHFDDQDDRDEVLEVLSKFTFCFKDATYDTSYNIYIKREKTFEIRMVGRFRHHFHEALEQHFKGMASDDPKYQPGNWKLHWAYGQLFLHIQDDDHLLMTFAKGIPKDASEIEANNKVLQMFNLAPEQADALIAAALVKAEAEKK